MAFPNRVFDPARWGQALAALRLGNSRKASFAYVGIPLSTAYYWMKEGASYPDPDRPGELLTISGEELTMQVEQARGQAEIQTFHNLADCTRGNPEFLWRRLKMLNPEEWGGAEQNASKVTVEVADKSTDAEDFKTRMEQIAQKTHEAIAAKSNEVEATEVDPDEAEGR